MRNTAFAPKLHSGISLRGSYIIARVNDISMAAGKGGDEGHIITQTANFLVDIAPQSKKPTENWNFGISFISDVAFANTRPDLVVDSLYVFICISLFRFRRDTNF